MLPRRVPWLSRNEFQEVYTWIFAPTSNVESQQRALNRMLVWIARGTCPQAIESTADLLDASIQATHGSMSAHALRLLYAMAIIRFVNGLVDPVQQGYYARSIGSIATQIALPLHFVDLRHAATHENLPSLTILRDAVKQALDWLYRRYWLPQMSSETATSSFDEHLRTELAELLRSYRRQQTATMKDASQADGKKLEMTMAAIEKLIGSPSTTIDDTLGILADRLVEKGALVARQDRSALVDSTYTLSYLSSDVENWQDLTVPTKGQVVWMPLLKRLDEAFEGFAQILLLKMLEVVCSQQEGEETVSLSTPSDALQLAAWSLYIAAQLASADSLLEITIRLCLMHPNELTISMLRMLAKRTPSLQSLMPLAKTMISSNTSSAPAPENVDERLDAMETRLRVLSSSLDSIEESSGSRIDRQALQTDSSVEVEWRPCPIGTLPYGRAQDLTWPVVTAVQG